MKGIMLAVIFPWAATSTAGSQALADKLISIGIEKGCPEVSVNIIFIRSDDYGKTWRGAAYCEVESKE